MSAIPFCTAIDLGFKMGVTRLRVCFQPPSAEEKNGALWVPAGAVIGLTLFLEPAFGKCRWHCYVIRAGREEEPGILLPFATPGVDVLFYSSTKRQAAFFLAALEVMKTDEVQPSQLDPNYFRQLQHHLNLPQRYWRARLA